LVPLTPNFPHILFCSRLTLSPIFLLVNLLSEAHNLGWRIRIYYARIRIQHSNKFWIWIMKSENDALKKKP
jgi:hypothetical protein